MKSFFLMSAEKPLRADFVPVVARDCVSECAACKRNTSYFSSPLLYEWDSDFGTPEESLANGHDFLWGDHQLLVTDSGRDFLITHHLAFEFLNSQPVNTYLNRRTLEIEYLPPPDIPLFWARPTRLVSGVVSQVNDEVCESCGQYIDHPARVSRLLFPESAQGVFYIEQHTDRRIFVDRGVLNVFDEIPGIGFFKAGRSK